MLNPTGNRHLRGVTGSSQPSVGHQSLAEAEAGGQQPLSPHQQQEELQQDRNTWQHHRQQRQRPTGRASLASSCMGWYWLMRPAVPRCQLCVVQTRALALVSKQDLCQVHLCVHPYATTAIIS